MNFRQLVEKNRNQPVLLRPKTIRMTPEGEPLPFLDDEWRLSEGGGKSIQLDNTRTGHTIKLGADNIQEFRTPNFLMLKCRLTLTGRKVLLEPFTWR